MKTTGRALTVFILVFVISISTIQIAQAYTLLGRYISNNMVYVPYFGYTSTTKAGFTARANSWNTYLPTSSKLSISSATHIMANYPIYDGSNLIYNKPMGATSGILGENQSWVWNTGEVAESDINLNPDYPLTNGAASGQYDMQSIMLHELGHTIGLDHSTAFPAVMYYALSPGITKTALTADDVMGVQAIY